MKHSTHLRFLTLLVTGVSTLALLSACDNVKNPFAVQRAKQEVMGARRVPLLNNEQFAPPQAPQNQPAMLYTPPPAPAPNPSNVYVPPPQPATPPAPVAEYVPPPMPPEEPVYTPPPKPGAPRVMPPDFGDRAVGTDPFEFFDTEAERARSKKSRTAAAAHTAMETDMESAPADAATAAQESPRQMNFFERLFNRNAEPSADAPRKRFADNPMAAEPVIESQPAPVVMESPAAPAMMMAPAESKPAPVEKPKAKTKAELRAEKKAQQQEKAAKKKEEAARKKAEAAQKKADAAAAKSVKSSGLSSAGVPPEAIRRYGEPAPAPMMSAPVEAAVEPEMPQTQPESGNVFERFLKNNIPAQPSSETAPPPWQSRSGGSTVVSEQLPDTGDNSLETNGGEPVMNNESPNAEPISEPRSESPNLLDRIFNRQEDPNSPLKEEAKKSYPALSTVPAKPSAFESIKDNRESNLNELANDHAVAQEEKQALDAEPSQQQQNVVPVENTAPKPLLSKEAPRKVAPVPPWPPQQAQQADGEPVLLGHASAPVQPTGKQSVVPGVATPQPPAPPSSASALDAILKPPSEYTLPETGEESPTQEFNNSPDESSPPEEPRADASVPSNLSPAAGSAPAPWWKRVKDTFVKPQETKPQPQQPQAEIKAEPGRAGVRQEAQAPAAPADPVAAATVLPAVKVTQGTAADTDTASTQTGSYFPANVR